MRRAPSLLALLTAAIACAVLGVSIAIELRASAPTQTPRDAVERATEERADARDARFAAADGTFDVAFDDDMVRDRVAWRERAGGPETTDLAIVNATSDADLVETARACVAAQPRRTRVQCYVFAGTEAYEFKNITSELQLDTPTAIVNLCWAVLASNVRPGGPVTISDMRDAAATWEAQQCPDGWQGDRGGAA